MIVPKTLLLSALSAYLCEIKRVTDGARTRDLRSHNPPTDVARGSLPGQSTHIQAKSRV